MCKIHQKFFSKRTALNFWLGCWILICVKLVIVQYFPLIAFSMPSYFCGPFLKYHIIRCTRKILDGRSVSSLFYISLSSPLMVELYKNRFSQRLLLTYFPFCYYTFSNLDWFKLSLNVWCSWVKFIMLYTTVYITPIVSHGGCLLRSVVIITVNICRYWRLLLLDDDYTNHR